MTCTNTPGTSVPKENAGPYKHRDALVELGEDYTPEDRIDYAIHVLIDEVSELGAIIDLGGLSALPPMSLIRAGLTLLAAEQALTDLRSGDLSSAEDYVRLGEKQLTEVPLNTDPPVYR